MSTVEQLEEEKPKGFQPRVIRGGKGPPEAPAGDWLSPLERGTTFVCRQNATTIDGELYHILWKGTSTILLKWCLPDGKMWDRYVHPPSFCKHYREHEVLGIHNLPEEGEDNDSDRSD